MRLSLLSDDNDVAELLINKAMELMSQAETAAAEAEGDTGGNAPTGAAGDDRNRPPNDRDTSPH